MKLEGIAAYGVQTELNKPLATQTKQSTNSVTQNFEDDVVNISATNADQVGDRSKGNSTNNHGSGWIPPE